MQIFLYFSLLICYTFSMESEFINLIAEEKLKELLTRTINQEFSVLVDKVKRLENKLLDKDETIEHLREQVRYLQSMLFGRKSEKKIYQPESVSGQLELNFDDPESMGKESKAEDTTEEEPETVEVKGHTRRKRNKALSDDLPVIEEVIDIPESEKICRCGGTMQVIGRETSDHLEYFPSRKFIIRYVYLKYACKHCEGTATEGISPTVIKAETREQLIPKSFATPSLLAYLVTSKFNDSLPLYRLSKMLERDGVRLGRATMSNWMLRIAPMMKPIIEIFKENLLKSPVIHFDETYFQVNREPGKAASTKSYMWVMCSGKGSPPTIIYNYSPRREQSVFCNLIQDYRGFLMTDGYSAYNITDKAGSGIVHLNCMAHARRKFSDVLKSLEKRCIKQDDTRMAISTEAIKLIAKLYATEKKIREKEEEGCPMTAEEIACFRQEKSKPVMLEIKNKLEEWKKKVTPKSSTGIAVNYFLNHYEQLSRYITDGRLPIDNNLAENNIRPFTLGRKNWLFNDTVKGAETSAIFYSIIRTAVANGLEPYWYMRYLLDNLIKLKSKEDFYAFIPQIVSEKQLKEYKEQTIAYENTIIAKG